LPCYVDYPELPRGVSRGLNHFLDHVRSFFPEDLRVRINISTTHKYKGLEERMVVILDAVERSYPLIHSDWVFSRIHGDDLEKITSEERRLLYVALTRAISKLVVLSFKRNVSPFLQELEGHHPLEELDWEEYPPFQIGEATSLVVKVGGGGTYEIRDRLRSLGYRWQPAGWPAWEKSFPVENFSVDLLRAEAWAAAANGVDVRIFDETETLVEAYAVSQGQWERR
jgi:DNA helicase-4